MEMLSAYYRMVSTSGLEEGPVGGAVSGSANTTKHQSSIMKLRTLSQGIVGAITLGLCVIALSLWQISTSIVDVRRLLDHRQATMALTLEFSKMTDMLTRLVRTYVVTGQSRYLMLYYDIAGYRNGERKFSSDISSDYWEQMIAGSRLQAPEAAGGMSFPDRLNAAGFSAEELEAFQQALTIGQKLHEIEQVAFAATQGLYDPKSKQFVSDGEPRTDYAIKLVYGDDYAKLEADLSKQIKVFTSLADRRTQTAFETSREHLIDVVRGTNVVLVGVFFAAILLGLFVKRRVLRPLAALTSAVERIGGGDYRCRAPHQPAFDEHRMLVAGVNTMAQAVEDDIDRRQEIMASLDTARAEAEAATRAKSMFLANMSHEIRTPMNAIMGMAHLALRTDMTPRQRDYVGKIDIAAKSLLSVINDILDFSKIEAGRLDVERLPFDLIRVVENSLLMVRERAVMKEIELLLEIDPRLTAQPWLDGDGMRLGQVLNNLLFNAVKFTHHGYVRLSIEVVQEDDETRTVMFAVTDTGIGMSPEQTGRLFQEFTQADGSITRQFGGTGLGLAICKRLVTLMGGSIEIDSELNIGSTFRFFLSFGRIEQATEKRRRFEAAAPLRALVVDDMPEAARALKSVLAGFGVYADTAASGADAVDKLNAAVAAGAPFSLAFVDWMMPTENGGQVMARIRRNVTPCPDMVVVSAYDNDAIHDALSVQGADHFLAKPVLPDAMSRLLSSLSGDTETALVTGQGDGEGALRRFCGLRVLLTEDNLINQQVALEMLRNAGIDVDLATNGREAIDRLTALPPDHYHLVLMDLEMPVLDGLEATRLLRADARFRSLPIVAMTAHALAETRERCRALGMVGHLTKPIDTDEFFATLAEHYQRAKCRGTLTSAAVPAVPTGRESAVVAVAGGDRSAEPAPETNDRPPPPPEALPAASPGDDKETPVPLAALSILVAEDDVISQMVVSGLLERAGASVTMVSSGLEAVELVTTRPFDLVLMDVQMPEMDGIEATRRIRALSDPLRAAIPIIALTASVTREETDLFLRGGMNATVAKPLRGYELVDAIIGQIAAGGRAGEPAFMDETPVAQRVAELGTGQVSRILRLFPNLAGTAVTGIRVDLARADLPAVAAKAHGLAGAAGTIGVQRLYLEAKALERAARDNDLGRCSTLLRSIEATLAPSLAALLALADRLDGRGPVP